MSRTIDTQFWKIANKYMSNGKIPLNFMKHYLDYIFLVFLGTIKNFEILNLSNPSNIEVHTQLIKIYKSSPQPAHAPK